MKTKLTFVLILLMTVLQLVAFPAPVTGDDPAATTMTEAELNTAIMNLKTRVERLQESRKNATSREEKQQMRAEIRDIKKEAKQLKQQGSSGVFIGIGIGVLLALVLVLLLR